MSSPENRPEPRPQEQPVARPSTSETAPSGAAGGVPADTPGRGPGSGNAGRTIGRPGRNSPSGASSLDAQAGSGSPQGKGAEKETKAKKTSKSSDGQDWNVFRTVVVLVGVVLAAFGVYYLITGTAGLPETSGSPVNPTLENQFRFFAAMMVGVGAAFVTIAIKFQWANMLWLVCLMVFIGGIGRVLSWAFSGTPHFLMIILMVIELAFPAALLVWHKYIAKTSEMRREYADRG